MNPTNETFDDAKVLGLLATETYDAVRAITGWSRGRIYALALKSGARKTERRIQERGSERLRRQQEAFASMLNTTVKADVLDFLESLPSCSINSVVTSPPYCLGKAYGGHAAADSMRAVYFHGWLQMVLSECARVLAPGGSIFLQVGSTRDWQDRLMPLDVLVFEDLRRTGLLFQSRVAWIGRHGLTPKRKLAERYETALVFSKGEPVFNPNTARVAQKEPGKRAFKGPKIGELSGHPYGAFPSNVWGDIPPCGHHHPDKAHGAHPAQFPTALAKRAILLYTRAGDVVCDPFCGSGSTQVAALETGRAFVGADLFYEELRERRVANAQADRVSLLPGISNESSALWQAEARRVDVPAKAVTAAEEVRQISLALG